MVESAETDLHGGEQASRQTGIDAGYAPSRRRAGPAAVPESLAPVDGETGPYDFVILGAGCAGLSLCHYLLECGVEGRILLLDGRTSFEDDRTWCFWDVEDTPFSGLAMKRWSSWSVVTQDRTISQTSERYPYLCLTAADFYARALKNIARHPNVTLRLGERVRGYEEHDHNTVVTTSEGYYNARFVFDGRGLPPGSPIFEQARRSSTWVPQMFLGQRLRTAKPVFDPEVCTLMDFSVSQRRGLRFTYVLPFDTREALVENVYLSEVDVSAADHRREISDYLRDSYGLSPDEYLVDDEESGYIPMTDHPFPRRAGRRAYSIGMLGGETRPSTGYTFLRIQRYCRALAEALTTEEIPPERTESRRFEALDRVFLRFMRRHPEQCPGIYGRMFARVPPDALVHFLTETSSPSEELRLILALPKTPFLKIAGGMLLEAGASVSK